MAVRSPLNRLTRGGLLTRSWTGQTLPPLETLWSLYLKRFCIEHWYRFIRQRLHWCLPQFELLPLTEKGYGLMNLNLHMVKADNCELE